MRYLSILLLLLCFAPPVRSQVIDWGHKTNDQSLYYYYYGSGGSGYNQQTQSVVTDKLGNAYVTGMFIGSFKIGSTEINKAGYNFYVAKVSPTGDVLWMKSGPSIWYTTSSVTLDSSDGVYLQSAFIGSTISFEGNVLAAGLARRRSCALWKLDTGGNYQWGKVIATFKDTAGFYSSSSEWYYGAAQGGAAVQADRAGNIYCHFIYEDSVKCLGVDYIYPKKRCGMLLKLNKNGALTWIREMRTLDTFSSYHQYMYYRPKAGLAVTPSGHAYLTTRGLYQMNFGDTTVGIGAVMHYMLKISPAGKYIWKKDLAQVASVYDASGFSLSCDATEAVYMISGEYQWNSGIVAGDTLGRLGIIKFDSSNKRVWFKQIANLDSNAIPYQTNGWGYWSNHCISVSGYGQMVVAFGAGAIVKYDQHMIRRKNFSVNAWGNTCLIQINDRGELIWADLLEGEKQNFAVGVAMKHDHGVYINGSFLKTMIGRDTMRTATDNQFEGFLLKYTGVDLMTPSPGKMEYCAGDTVQVWFEATRKFHSGNVYQAQLSDTAGVFNTKVKIIGQYDTNDSLGMIECVLPQKVISGATYRIKVTGTDPYFDATNAGPEFIIYGPPAVSIRSKDTNVCAGEILDLTGRGAVTYSWSTGDTSTIISVTKAGRYILAGYNHIGCVGYDTIDVHVLAVPTATVKVTGATTFCDGGQVKLSALGGKTYRWSTGEVTQEIIVKKSGLYTVTATNAAGCTDESETIQVTVLESPDKPTFVREGDTLVSSADEHNQWYNYGQPIKDETNKMLTLKQNGRYAVRVTLEDGCYRESDAQNILLETKAVALTDLRFTLDIVYAPKPQIRCASTSSVSLKLELIDQLGHLITLLHNDRVSGTAHFDIPSDLPSGVYYVRASVGDQVQTRKVAVTK
jgi:hypothetical protein